MTKMNLGVQQNTLETNNQKDFRRIDYADAGRKIQLQRSEPQIKGLNFFEKVKTDFDKEIE